MTVRIKKKVAKIQEKKGKASQNKEYTERSTGHSG